MIIDQDPTGSDAFGDTIAGMFDIPEQNIIEQAEESMTLGSESYETGKIDTTPEEPWDPLGDL